MVWYIFYGKLSVNQMGPQAGRAVLQLHPALDLLHRGPSTCTGCYRWVRCKNRGNIMPYPTMASGLLGHFL